MATYKEIEKQMAALRKEVLAWKIQTDSKLVQDYARDFENTFKAARSVLLSPENGAIFSAVPKRRRMEMFIGELEGYHAGISLLVMKQETEIKDSPEGLKKDSEIKQEDEPENSTKKKETEIKGEQMQISIRGGRRAGAGRKSLGVKKPVSITLPEHIWNEIDNQIQERIHRSYADYFRSLILDDDRRAYSEEKER